MFAEYRLREDAHQKALIQAMSTSGAFVLAAFSIWGYVFVFEKELLFFKPMFIYILVGILILASVLSGIKTYRKLINFRMMSTDEHLEMTTSVNTVKVRYADILRVERTKQNVLMIYTVDSNRLPVVAISDTITNREYLEQLLQQFVPIQEGKLPLQYNRYYRLAFSYVLMTVMLLHYVSMNGNTIVATGVMTLAVFAWSTSVSFRFRHQIPMWRGLIVTILVGITVCLRILMTLHPDLFQ